MALFTKEDYAAEVKRIENACASGRIPALSQLNVLRALGGEMAENDYDLDVLTVDIETRHLKKRISAKKAATLLSVLRRNQPERKSEYASSFLRSFADYYSRCVLRERRKKKAFIACVLLTFVLVSCALFGWLYAERTGMFYGTGEVTFTADGKTYTQNAIRFNEYVTLDLPEKTGYDIVGVNDRNTGKRLFDGDGVSNSKVKEKDLSDYSNCELTVVYVPHLYSATIRSATGIETESFTYTIEDDPTDLIEDPQSMKGYVFDGWYTDSRYKKPFTGNFADYTDEPLILYPHYSLDGWTIRWDTQGGEMIVGALEEYTIMTDVPLPKGDVVKKAGYRLIGWTVNGRMVEYFPASSMSDVTLVAVWEPEEYSVIYHLNGGVLSDAEYRYTVEDGLQLPVPERPAYLFDGWYTSASYQTQIIDVGEGTIGDTNVYAKWTPVTYRIEYTLSGGTNSPLNPQTYQAPHDVHLAEPKKTGYRFDGWYDRLSGEYKSVLSAEKDQTVSLVAVWSPLQYTVTVYPDNGRDAFSQTVTYDGYYNLTAPSYPGYSLKEYTVGDQVISPAGIFRYDSDIVAIAHYEAKTYQIVYVSEGVTVHTQTVEYGQPFHLYSPEERENYEFTGWRNRSVGGDLVCEGIYENDGNTVLCADWQKIMIIELESGRDYTVDNTVEKVYVIGNCDGTNVSVTDVCIKISMRDKDLTVCLINAGFRAKNDRVAIDCENSSYKLTVLLTGTSVIEGGNGSNGADGKSGSSMTESNRNGQNGKNGCPALNCGRIIFENAREDSSLLLKGGDGGSGGNGGIDRNRSRMWLNYVPDGGNGGNSGSAIRCVSYSVNGASVTLEKGNAGTAGKAGSRGDWWCGACYGHAGTAGKQTDMVEYK